MRFGCWRRPAVKQTNIICNLERWQRWRVWRRLCFREGPRIVPRPQETIDALMPTLDVGALWPLASDRCGEVGRDDHAEELSAPGPHSHAAEPPPQRRAPSSKLRPCYPPRLLCHAHALWRASETTLPSPPTPGTAVAAASSLAALIGKSTCL